MDQNLDQFAYEALRAFSLSHNYNKSIFETFKPYIGGTVLEIGSGIGNISRYLLQSCDKLIGVDTSDLFMKHLKIDYPQIDLYNYDFAGDAILSLKDKNIGTIVAINVLEHIEDDEKALRNAYNILAPKGHLLVFVPALRSLFGTIDKNVSHFRRYEKDDLEKKLKAAGFNIEKMYFSNFIGVFGWLLNGRILKRKTFPVLQPLLFDKLVPMITLFEKLVKIPFGMNLIAIATKP